MAWYVGETRSKSASIETAVAVRSGRVTVGRSGSDPLAARKTSSGVRSRGNSPHLQSREAPGIGVMGWHDGCNTPSAKRKPDMGSGDNRRRLVMEWKNLAIASALSLALGTGAGGVLTGSALAAGTPSTPTIVTPADLGLAASIDATLRNDRWLPFANIGVGARDGAVVLSGTVRSEGERARAIADAKNVPGGKTLADKIAVVEMDD